MLAEDVLSIQLLTELRTPLLGEVKAAWLIND